MSALAQKLDHTAGLAARGFERRGEDRKHVNLHSRTFREPSYFASIKVVDISTGGCRLLDHGNDFAVDDVLTFSLNGEVVVEGVVRWSSGQHCGVEFLSPLSEDIVASVG